MGLGLTWPKTACPGYHAKELNHSQGAVLVITISVNIGLTFLMFFNIIVWYYSGT